MKFSTHQQLLVLVLISWLVASHAYGTQHRRLLATSATDEASATTATNGIQSIGNTENLDAVNPRPQDHHHMPQQGGRHPGSGGQYWPRGPPGGIGGPRYGGSGHDHHEDHGCACSCVFGVCRRMNGMPFCGCRETGCSEYHCGSRGGGPVSYNHQGSPGGHGGGWCPC